MEYWRRAEGHYHPCQSIHPIFTTAIFLFSDSIFRYTGTGVFYIFKKVAGKRSAGSMFKACQKFRLPTCVHFASHWPSGATLGSSVAGQHGLHGLHQPRQDSLENKKSEKVSAAAHQVQPCDVSAHGRLPAALPEGPLAAGGVGGAAGGEGGGEGGGGEARPGDGGQEEAAHGIL